MQPTYTLSQKELQLLIIEYFRKLGKKVTSVSFHRTEIDRPYEICYHAIASVEEELISIDK